MLWAVAKCTECSTHQQQHSGCICCLPATDTHISATVQKQHSSDPRHTVAVASGTASIFTPSAPTAPQPSPPTAQPDPVHGATPAKAGRVCPATPCYSTGLLAVFTTAAVAKPFPYTTLQLSASHHSLYRDMRVLAARGIFARAAACLQSELNARAPHPATALQRPTLLLLAWQKNRQALS
jgi:hypothetical protein